MSIFSSALAALGSQYTMLIILAAFFVLMIVMTIIPQKKRKKQQEQMMSSLSVGVKVMTIGRLIGTIVGIDNANNTLVLNVGSEDSPTYITIDRNAIGMVMSPVSSGMTIDEASSSTDDTAASTTDDASSDSDENSKN